MPNPLASEAATRVGVGGWTFEPWRDNFYPKGWPAARELEYASRKLSAIEINGTYYSTQKPETFAKWREQTPEGFVFTLKAHRLATNRRVLAEAGESVERFVRSGLAELGPKLGPIVWQFAPTKQFDPHDFEAFLKLLPASVSGLQLQHALDVRHESFMTAEYLALARRYRMATVFTDSDDYPSFADVTGEFVYVRAMRTDASLPQGCTPQALDAIAACCEVWRSGAEPAALPLVESATVSRAKPAPSRPVQPSRHAVPRDVYLFFISGAKEKAPAAAMAVRERLAAHSAAG